MSSVSGKRVSELKSMGSQHEALGVSCVMIDVAEPQALFTTQRMPIPAPRTQAKGVTVTLAAPMPGV